MNSDIGPWSLWEKSQYENRVASSYDCDDGCASFSKRCSGLKSECQKLSSKLPPRESSAGSRGVVGRDKSRRTGETEAPPGCCTLSSLRDGSSRTSPPTPLATRTPWKARAPNSSLYNQRRRAWSPK